MVHQCFDDLQPQLGPYRALSRGNSRAAFIGEAHHLWQLEIAHVFNELLEFAEFSRDSDFAENDL